MTVYLPPRDSKGRLIDLTVTVQCRPYRVSGPLRVGRVIAISGNTVTVRFPITEEAVLDEAGRPTGRYRALTFPKTEQADYPAENVTLWG